MLYKEKKRTEREGKSENIYRTIAKLSNVKLSNRSET